MEETPNQSEDALRSYRRDYPSYSAWHRENMGKKNGEVKLYSQWRREQRQALEDSGDTLLGWVEESRAAIEQINAGLSEWFAIDAYQEKEKRLNELMNRGERWKVLSADNQELASYIDEIKQKLVQERSAVFACYDTYSQYDSAEAYEQGVRKQEQEKDKLRRYDVERGALALEKLAALDQKYNDIAEKVNVYRNSRPMSDLSEKDYEHLCTWLVEAKNLYGLGEEESFQTYLEERKKFHEEAVKLQQEESFLEKYSQMDYLQMQQSIARLEDGDEKAWVEAYAPSVMTEQDYDYKIAALKAKRRDLEAFIDDYSTIDLWYQAYQNSPSSYDEEAVKKKLAKYNSFLKLKEQYGLEGDIPKEIDDVDSEISQTEANKKTYLRNQKLQVLSSVMDPGSENYDQAFGKLSGYVSTKSDTWHAGAQGAYYDDVVYEFINGNEEISEHVVGMENNYYYINDKERAIYNYYYAKEGREAAEAYLELLKDTLNARSAQERYEKLEGNTVLEILFGLEAGLDRFASGVANFFNTEDDYIPVSDTQILAGMVREDLADNSIPLWYNFKTGEWETEIFGSSGGQILYDVANSTANMLPAILVSAAANFVVPGSGAFVGAGLSGISSAGNAYQEMLNLGYDKGQARAYSTLVGASETGLSLALGGIVKLGGAATGHFIRTAVAGVDNAFARVAIKLGGNMLSEGAEEGLSEVLNPLFKRMTLDVNEEVDWEQVAYASVLGAVTANLFEGVGVVKENVGHYTDGKALQKAGVTPDQLAKIGKSLSDHDIQKLASRVDANTGAYTMGRLFHEIGANLSETNRREITAALESQGVRKKDAKILTQAITHVIDGGSFTQKQIQILEANDVLGKTVLNVMASDGAVMQRTIEFDGVKLALEGAESQGGSAWSGLGQAGETTGILADSRVQSRLSQFKDMGALTEGERYALTTFKNRLQEVSSLELELQKQRRILTKKQQLGASEIRQIDTKNRIALLENRLAQKRAGLVSMEAAPGLQQVMQKAGVDEIVIDQSNAQPEQFGENNQGETLENTQTNVKINAESNPDMGVGDPAAPETSLGDSAADDPAGQETALGDSAADDPAAPETSLGDSAADDPAASETAQASQQGEPETDPDKFLTNGDILGQIGEYIDETTLSRWQRGGLEGYRRNRQALSDLEAERQQQETLLSQQIDRGDPETELQSTRDKIAGLDSKISKAQEKLARTEKSAPAKSAANQVRNKLFSDYVGTINEAYELQEALKAKQDQLWDLQSRVERSEGVRPGRIAQVEAEIARLQEQMKVLEGKKREARARASSIIAPDDRKYLLVDDQPVIVVNGKRVILLDNVFSMGNDTKGERNRELMSDRKAPRGYDGEKVEMHHLDQTDGSIVVTLPKSVHDRYRGIIHTNTGQKPSQINRRAFNQWRKGFWKSLVEQNE